MGKRKKVRKNNRKYEEDKIGNIEEVSVDKSDINKKNTSNERDKSYINNINSNGNAGEASNIGDISKANCTIPKNVNTFTAEEFQKNLNRVSEELVALNLAKNSVEAMNIDESERLFFDRKVRPLVDSMYFLALTSSSVMATGQAFNSNQNGRRRDVKQALDLSSDINKEIECIFKTFQKRMRMFRCGIEKQVGECNGNCIGCNYNED